MVEVDFQSNPGSMYGNQPERCWTEGFESPPYYKTNSIRLNMKIEIGYNGSIATCKINGKYIHHAADQDVRMAFDAFRAVEQAHKRDKKFEY